MTELINKLYYIVEDWVGQHDLGDEDVRGLEARQEALREKIILRLGEDGQDMMEALADLNLKLETIHDQALFRAAMRLGAKITHSRRRPRAAAVSNDRTSAAAQTGGNYVESRSRRKVTLHSLSGSPVKTGGS